MWIFIIFGTMLRSPVRLGLAPVLLAPVQSYVCFDQVLMGGRE